MSGTQKQIFLQNLRLKKIITSKILLLFSIFNNKTND